MATRYIDNVIVRIQYRDCGDYAGTVSAPGRRVWRFSDLHAPKIGFGRSIAYDSPEAYDKMAQEAVGFGSYYTTSNRGEDTPDWAPSAAVADAIADNAWGFSNGQYPVRRSEGGPLVNAYECESCERPEHDSCRERYTGKCEDCFYREKRATESK